VRFCDIRDDTKLLHSNCHPTSDGDGGPLGEHDADDFRVIPQALLNLHNPEAMRAYDLSGMGPGADVLQEDQQEIFAEDNNSLPVTMDEQDAVNEGIQVVRNLSLVEFRKRLITHFDIAFHRNEINWWCRSMNYRTTEQRARNRGGSIMNVTGDQILNYYRYGTLYSRSSSSINMGSSVSSTTVGKTELKYANPLLYLFL
jgi:hypothetical protein